MNNCADLKPYEQEIFEVFTERRPRAYRLADLRAIFESKHATWSLPASIGFRPFFDFLLESNRLREAVLRPERNEYRSVKRYTWEGCTPLEVATTLKEKAYLSHGTAMFLHGLTEQIPRTIYVNREQSAKPASRGPLLQASLDRAFRSKQRTSRYIFVLDDHRYVLLSGKQTNDYGVLDVSGPSGEPLRLTSIARTLVDIAVRPAYAGGIVEVLGAYSAARDLVDAESVLEALKRIDHFYPYHQAIGFLMDRAGFSATALKVMRTPGLNHDFYLTHGMSNPEFDRSWRVFHPQGF